jgi:hypothetical protein
MHKEWYVSSRKTSMTSIFKECTRKREKDMEKERIKKEKKDAKKENKSEE